MTSYNGTVFITTDNTNTLGQWHLNQPLTFNGGAPTVTRPIEVVEPEESPLDWLRRRVRETCEMAFA